MLPSFEYVVFCNVVRPAEVMDLFCQKMALASLVSLNGVLKLLGVCVCVSLLDGTKSCAISEGQCQVSKPFRLVCVCVCVFLLPLSVVDEVWLTPLPQLPMTLVRGEGGRGGARAQPARRQAKGRLGCFGAVAGAHGLPRAVSHWQTRRLQLGQKRVKNGSQMGQKRAKTVQNGSKTSKSGVLPDFDPILPVFNPILPVFDPISTRFRPDFDPISTRFRPNFGTETVTKTPRAPTCLVDTLLIKPTRTEVKRQVLEKRALVSNLVE